MADIKELEEQIAKLPIGYITEKVINEKKILLSAMERKRKVKKPLYFRRRSKYSQTSD